MSTCHCAALTSHHRSNDLLNMARGKAIRAILICWLPLPIGGGTIKAKRFNCAHNVRSSLCHRQIARPCRGPIQWPQTVVLVTERMH